MEVDADAQPLGHGATTRAEPHPFGRAGRLLAMYWLAMFIGTHVKLADSVDIFQIRDKVVHFAAYAGLAFLAAAFQRSRKGEVGWLDLAAIWLLAAGYGLFDEITQTYVGRTCDPLDWLADLAGAATGLIAFLAHRSYQRVEGR